MDPSALAAIQSDLVRRHGASQTDRIRRGLAQVAARWRTEDGDVEALGAFARSHFQSEPGALRATAQHLEYALEMLDGHHYEIERELSRYQQLDEGPEQPVDALLASFSPSAHSNEDLFRTKIAFAALLNFPLSSLEERLRDGATWSREQWALARLAARFEFRVPAAIVQQIDQASTEAESYIDHYNIRMDRVVRSDGTQPFPEGLRLISHWGLRDEIRAQYARTDGLERQRLLARIMERIVRQQIPARVIDSPDWQWDPEQNRVRSSAGEWVASDREPDVRYAELSKVFQAIRRADPYYPGYPTYVDRLFDRDREIPEARVRELFESVLRSGTAKRVADRMRAALGRPLEPFDIWYPGFRSSGGVDEAKLDELTRGRYPTVQAFQQDLPRILGSLGFATPTARFLADHIVVDPSRGPGHAAGAARRDDKAHLRTRVGAKGMDYKGFNIAIHELGHNVEQVFSMTRIDHTLLAGVPNGGFTEAFAFLFQARDRELLGQAKPDPRAEALKTLDRFWSTFEIAGVAMLDMELWHWLYDHPTASPAEIREATVRLAADVWDRYYAPVLGVRGSVLPAIYSHIIAFGLYTPDYPLGLLITFQIEQFLRGKNLGTEMERMCRLGRLAPDVWMMQAVGSNLSSAPLLAATEEALQSLGS